MSCALLGLLDGHRLLLSASTSPAVQPSDLPAVVSLVVVVLFLLIWWWYARKALLDHRSLPYSRYK